MVASELKETSLSDRLASIKLPPEFADFIDNSPIDAGIHIAAPSSKSQAPEAVGAAFDAMDTARFFHPLDGAKTHNILEPIPDKHFNRELATAGLRWIHEQFRQDQRSNKSDSGLVQQSAHTLKLLESSNTRPSFIREIDRTLTAITEAEPSIAIQPLLAVFLNLKPRLNAERGISTEPREEYQQLIDELADRAINDPNVYIDFHHGLTLIHDSTKDSPAGPLIRAYTYRARDDLEEAMVKKTSSVLDSETMDVWLAVPNQLPKSMDLMKLFAEYDKKNPRLSARDKAVVLTISMGIQLLSEALVERVEKVGVTSIEIIDTLYLLGHKGLVKFPMDTKTHFTGSVFTYFFEKSPVGAGLLAGAQVLHPDENTKLKALDLLEALERLGIPIPKNKVIRKSDKTKIRTLLGINPVHTSHAEEKVLEVIDGTINLVQFLTSGSPANRIGTICGRLGIPPRS